MILHLLMWLVVGFLAGLLAKAIVPGPAEKPSGFLPTALLGIVGAVVGGFIYHLVTGSRAFQTTFDLASILWAALGAIVVVAIERMVAGRNAV
ncbi:MAG: GlsB/YeaQ/YmgE family stress response membrane protein [Armatimonadota bacterium]|nr:GlsB/YeaQ/YmgE family stress response membrane protein [Armatimonadota bacterium]